MKKLLLISAILMGCSYLNAQNITEKDFCKYDNKDLFIEDNKIDYETSAIYLTKTYKVDSESSISRNETINFNGISKDKLYKYAKEWSEKSFKDGKSEIKNTDNTNYTIICKGYIEDVAQHSSLTTNSKMNGTVIMQISAEKGKINIKTTIVSYEMEMKQGVLGNLGGVTYSIWQPAKSFPYIGKKYKMTASKALVNCHIWSKLMADEMSEFILKAYK